MTPTALDSDFAAESIPSRYGRYRVVRELGRGGMARVFEGQHSELGRRVALKVMQPALAAHPHAAARFLREAKAASHIRHQHVVEVFDVGVENAVPFLVMEFLEGANLAALLAEKGPLTVHGIAEIFLPVISAVGAAHAAGVVHRDLKPANLMITRRPPHATHPMVLDFGISKFINDEDLENTLTRSESLLGTVQYMAPELTRGAKFASPASDQYAVGVMLYECATGRRPFAGNGHYELMHAILTAPVVPPSELRPELPPEFDAIVARAMHRTPAERFPSMKALGSALLSLGDRAVWSTWERDFIGGSDEGGPWQKTSTLHDGALAITDAAAARAAKGRPAPRGKLGSSWKVRLLSAYAAATTLALASSQWESKEKAPAPRAETALAPSAAPLSELRTNAEPATSNNATTFNVPPTANIAAASSTGTMAAGATPLPLTTASAARSPTSPKTTAASPPSTIRTLKKPAVLGTNGALIVD